jgi:hypothetical protein
MKTIDIKGKAYIEVNERLKEFRSNPKYDGFSLVSELIQLENGICTIKAIISNANGVVVATGFAQEKEDSSFINKTSFIENCETSAWGRALGNLGIGIDTSIASADEVLNAIKNQEEKPKKTTPIKKPVSQDDYNKQIDEQLAVEQNKRTCADCGVEITEKVHSFSRDTYGKPLCFKCQKNNPKLTTRINSA